VERSDTHRVTMYAKQVYGFRKRSTHPTGCKDRSAAQGILSAIRNRDALANFARALKVHVVKHDRREDIEAKIVEFVIGGKLRTEAIQSLNLKGGSGRQSDDGSST
jgi:hypothetical protein